LEHRRQCRLEVIDERVHAVAKLARTPFRQFDGYRLSGIGEIVHVYPIGGAFSLARRLSQSLFDRVP